MSTFTAQRRGLRGRGGAIPLAAVALALAAGAALPAAPAPAAERPGGDTAARGDRGAAEAARAPRSAAEKRAARVKRKQRKRRRGARRQRPAYWGAWIGTQLTGGQPPWDMSAVERFRELVGKAPSLLHFSAPFALCARGPCEQYPFPRWEMATIRAYGAIPFFSWGSQSVPVPPDLDLPGYRLAAIAAGAHDEYIRRFAEGSRDWGHPYFLRFDWEMNGDWFPWGEHANGNSPGDYVRAWRHVRDIFRSVGANNATWVWCPYAHARLRFGGLARYYPGDEYVDWTCLDGFNWARNGVNPQPWRSFDEIFARTYRTLVRRLAPGKPVMLAEMASGGGPRAKARWLRDMFTQLRTRYRRVRGLLWFEQVDRGVQWPITSSPAATRAFARGIAQPGFQANRFQALAGAPILPPR